jgi:mRNA-degrading endonuclease RelE of RelBE toxin-antitoxin system
MFRVVLEKTFVSHFKKLPRSIQVRTDELVSLLVVDFRDSRLHTKKLTGVRDVYSFRVGRDYRCLFCFETGGTILLLDIQHRKDIYREL